VSEEESNNSWVGRVMFRLSGAYASQRGTRREKRERK
jgi:hypothetical protein